MYVVVRITHEGEELVASLGEPVRFPQYHVAHAYVEDLYTAIKGSDFDWHYRIDPASEWVAELMAAEARNE